MGYDRSDCLEAEKRLNDDVLTGFAKNVRH